MLRFFYYTARYGPYLHSKNGIKELAEAFMGRLSYKMSKRAATSREINQSLIVEKVDLLRRADELSRETTLEPGEFSSARKRIWGGALLVVTAFLVAAFFGCASAAAFASHGAESVGIVFSAASILLAMLLVGSGLFACERLLDAFSWRGALHLGQKELQQREQSVDGKVLPWALLLICVELAIVGVATVPASLLAEQAATTATSTLFYGAILIVSLLLPLIAGFACRDVLERIDAYRNTQAQHRIEVRLAQVEAILYQNGWDQKSFFEWELLALWNRLSSFKAYKGYHDAKKGLSEEIGFHFAESYKAFQAEAKRRCEAYMDEGEGLSSEHLEEQLRSAMAGRRSERLPLPRTGDSREGDGHGDVSWSEIRVEA